jgi:hypothetical protein
MTIDNKLYLDQIFIFTAFENKNNSFYIIENQRRNKYQTYEWAWEINTAFTNLRLCPLLLGSVPRVVNKDALWTALDFDLVAGSRVEGFADFLEEREQDLEDHCLPRLRLHHVAVGGNGREERLVG